MIRLVTGRTLSLNPSRLRRVARAACLLPALLLLAACDQGHDSSRIDVVGNQADMSLTPPAFLQTRNIERQNLVVEITIDGQTFEGTPDQDGGYVLQITRPVNSSTTVMVVWLEIIGDIRLPLARASKLLNVGSEASPATLTFASSEFDREQDDLDNDGYSNFAERQLDDGSSFADPDVPEFPPGIVNLNVELHLPQDLVGASTEIRAAVDAQATIKDIQVPLAREGDVWRGTMTVTENTTPLITVNFFDTAERAVTLAYKARSQEVGLGAIVIFLADAYETEQYNDDGDGFSNIIEIVNGTDPRNSSDPGAPVADAGADVTITVGASVTLNASDSSGSNAAIVSYRWSEADQVLGTGVSLSIPGLDVGTHVIELLVTDSLGLTDTDSVSVTVDAAPVPNQLPVASAGTDQIIDSGASVTLNGSGSSDPDGTIALFEWSAGARQLGFGVSLVVSGLTDGTHEITLVVTDADGATDNDTVTIEVAAAVEPNELPEADAGANQSVASGVSVTLNGSGSSDPDGSIASYQWSEGAQQLGSGVSLVVDDLDAGSHEFTLLVTDNEGATDTDTVTVVVTAAEPEPNQRPVADAGEPQTINSGESVTMDGSSSEDPDGSIVSYQWSEAGAPLGTGVDLVIEDLDDGPHLITLLVTDNEGATDSATVSIQVTEAPAPNRPPEADAGIDQESSFGDSVTLDGSDSVDPDGTIVSYEWSEGTDVLGTGPSATLGVDDLAVGLHTIRLLITDNEDETDFDTVVIDVAAAPEPNLPPEADAGIDQESSFGDSVTLDGSDSVDPDGTIVSYEWSEGTDVLGTGPGATLGVDDLAVGLHTIRLLVTDNEDETDFDTVVIDVAAAPALNQPPMAEAGEDQTVNSGESVILNASASIDEGGEIISYEWFANDLSLDSGVIVEISGLADGSHEIDLVVTDNEGAEGMDSVTVTVTVAGDPPGDGAADSESNKSVEGAKTSATGALVIPLRTLA